MSYLQDASALNDLLRGEFDRVEVTEDSVFLLQLIGRDKWLFRHFFLPVFFFACVCCFCIFF